MTEQILSKGDIFYKKHLNTVLEYQKRNPELMKIKAKKAYKKLKEERPEEYNLKLLKKREHYNNVIKPMKLLEKQKKADLKNNLLIDYVLNGEILKEEVLKKELLKEEPSKIKKIKKINIEPIVFNFEPIIENINNNLEKIFIEPTEPTEPIETIKHDEPLVFFYDDIQVTEVEYLKKMSYEKEIKIKFSEEIEKYGLKEIIKKTLESPINILIENNLKLQEKTDKKINNTSYNMKLKKNKNKEAILKKEYLELSYAHEILIKNNEEQEKLKRILLEYDYNKDENDFLKNTEDKTPLMVVIIDNILDLYKEYNKKKEDISTDMKNKKNKKIKDNLKKEYLKYSFITDNLKNLHESYKKINELLFNATKEYF